MGVVMHLLIVIIIVYNLRANKCDLFRELIRLFEPNSVSLKR